MRIIAPILAWTHPKVLPAALAAACIAMVLACAGKPKHAPKSVMTVQDLDSLNRVNAHNDSVDANLMFYEHAFKEYHARFPGVDKGEYMRLANGKDQEFCLFKANPARTCLEVGDKFNDLNLKQPARDAYQAGLLSEGFNDSGFNVRLWGSMGQLEIEEKEYDSARNYLTKVLEVEPKNKWAKKLKASIPKE
ncbi:MAG: hypothetical protein JWP91_2954 [Fibrobacteres bacterium]|nr:hypothetical protein [Fibrobacterota bacterium]